MLETENSKLSVSVKEHKFPCKKCGADLVFAPGQSSLTCPYCSHVEKIPDTAEAIDEYSFNDYLAQPRSRGYGDSAGRDARCGSCGATTHLDASVRATLCAFCGAPLITGDAGAQSSENGGVITPEAIAPFQISAAQAQAAFKKWVGSLWFAPSSIKNENSMKQLQGVYRPFWTYDSHTASHWTGERGTHYWVTQTYTAVENGKSVTRTRQVRHTRWSSVSGVYSDFFDDVLVSAGHATDFKTEFQLAGLKPYAPEYLSGFGAERYVVSCEDGWTQAKVIIGDAIHAAVRRQIGGDEQRVHSVKTAYSGITYKHVLLPLWLSCYRYNNKTFCFQVNGQTGEVQGARPYSFWKIFFLVSSVLAVIAAIVLLAQRS